MARRWRWQVLGLAAVVAAATGAGCFEVGFGPRCGNGLLDDGETCDDGNDLNGDGCSARCDLELCLDCGICGDGIQSDGEQCDDGNLVDDDGCSSGCLLEVIGQCGDGIITLGEECDDGNNASGDGCDAFCRLEAAPGNCGNGVLEPGEFCDTEFGCNPDCIYSCVEPACQEPILQVAESSGGGTVGEPMVASAGTPSWAVAWRRTAPGMPAVVPGNAYVGNDLAAAVPGLDAGAIGFDIASPSLAGTAAGYVYASVRRPPASDRTYSVTDDLLGDPQISVRSAALGVRAAGRKDGAGAWIVAAPGDSTHSLERVAPLVVVTVPGPFVAAEAEAAPPGLAVNADGSVALAYAYDLSLPSPVFALQWFAANGAALSGEIPFPGSWGPEGPALASLANDTLAVFYRDAVTGDVNLSYWVGLMQTAPILIDTGIALVDAAPAIASAAGGDHVIAWSVDEAGCRRIRMLVLDPLGQLYGTPFEADGTPFIASGTDCNASDPALEVRADGSEVVLAWAGCPPGVGICPVIQARRFPGLVP